MTTFNSAAGPIKNSQIDFSKIYSSVQNAMAGINNVNVSQDNASWNSDNMTYKVMDNGVVMILNADVPIGFTTVDAIETSTNSGALNPGEELRISNDTYVQKMDDTLDDTGSPIPQEEAPAQELTPEYNEEPADEVKEEHNTPIHSGEEAPAQELAAEVDETAGEAVDPDNQQPPENPINVETVDAEVKDEAADVLTSEVSTTGFNFKHESSNILAAKAQAMGFTDEQIKIAVGISRWETGNYDHLCGGYNYGGVTGSGDAGSVVLKGRTYAIYTSMDAGMDAYLSNLKRNYFDQGLNSPESISSKYLGYQDDGSWTNGVKGCMN